MELKDGWLTFTSSSIKSVDWLLLAILSQADASLSRLGVIRHGVPLGSDIANDAGKTMTRVVTVWRKCIAETTVRRGSKKARDTVELNDAVGPSN